MHDRSLWTPGRELSPGRYGRTCMRLLLLPFVALIALAACGGPNETVRGYVVAPEGAPVRLCEALAESFPPQCGGSSVVVEGLDLASVPGLTSIDDPALAQVSWSEGEVELTGVVTDGVLRVG